MLAAIMLALMPEHWQRCAVHLGNTAGGWHAVHDNYFISLPSYAKSFPIHASISRAHKPIKHTAEVQNLIALHHWYWWSS
jgi:hypothetical protein